MILTDKEIIDLNEDGNTSYSSAVKFARAVEAAVLSKLAAGVSVEPVAEVQTLYYGSEHPPVAFTGVVLSDKTDYYSLPFRENAQLYTASAIAAARVQAIEYVAEAVENSNLGENMTAGRFVRALIGCANHGSR